MSPVTFWIGAAATILLLSACTGGQDEGNAPPGAGASASPTPEQSSPASAAGGSQRPADELEAVLTAINDAESLNAQVVPEAELRSSLDQGVGQAGDIAVTPEECNVYADSALDELAAEATYAAMTFAGESSLQPDSIVLASLPSEGSAVRQFESGRSQLDTCSEFTMEVSGEEINVTVEEVEAETAPDRTIALRTTVQVPGSIQESVSITSLVESTTISVSVGGSTDAEADLERAQRLLDLAAAELQER